MKGVRIKGARMGSRLRGHIHAAMLNIAGIWPTVEPRTAQRRA